MKFLIKFINKILLMNSKIFLSKKTKIINIAKFLVAILSNY